MVAIVFDKDESAFVEAVLVSAKENDTDIEKANELVHELTGANVAFVGGTEEFHEDPPSASAVYDCFSGQRFEGNRTQVEALQTVLSVYVFDLMRSRELDDPEGLMDLLDGIHDKITEAHEEAKDD